MRLHHVSLSVADLEGSIVWDLRVHEDLKVLFVRDNTGNLIEPVEPVDAAPARAAD